MDGVQQVAGRSAAGEHIAAALVRCNPAWASQPGENAVDSIPSAWWPWTRPGSPGLDLVALESIPVAAVGLDSISPGVVALESIPVAKADPVGV